MNATQLLAEAARLEATEPEFIVARELLRQGDDLLAAILRTEGLSCDANGLTYDPHMTPHKVRIDTPAGLRALCAHLGLPVPAPDEAEHLLLLIRLRAADELGGATRAGIEQARAKVLAQERGA